ncbi:DNA-binding transcriptional LysR family regulator [Silvibacterium bohemicum]|uniref:DNA-binding transcriptional LysR family regulator n=1 Tax=Silvibacterium bohemicum TaxID=1577686 RepID=A0A841JVU9_9BACT|nr:LysR family transcriptional regulator [Silvibacterium bohemicum]MBB6145476.1 DNA-binding transcriptional LysR family regulator [Silvibacterium bohemicum]
MEVRQLRIFSVLAEELNFTRTAERVNTVQSNVTAQIRSLEEELGIPLFDRLAKKVVLTEAGRRFLPYADRALSAMDQGQLAVKFGLEPAGPLRIGAPESVLTYRLPKVLQRFRKLYPKVELIFRPQWDAPLCESLEHGKLDMAISMTDEVLSENLKSVRLRTEAVFLISDPEHPLADKRAVQPEDLAGQTLLLTEAGCSYRKKLDDLLARLGVRPGSTTEFSSVEAIKHCLAAGMGIGLLPEIVVASELKAQKLKALRWDGPSLDIATHILWHRDRWVSPSMEAFLGVLTKTLDAN